MALRPSAKGRAVAAVIHIILPLKKKHVNCFGARFTLFEMCGKIHLTIFRGDLMKLYGGWSYRPFLPLDRDGERGAPIIVRLAPGADGIELEWLGADRGAEIVLRAEGEEERFLAEGNRAERAGLRENCEYTVSVRDTATGREGRARMFLTGEYPGTLVNYLHPDDEAYAFSGRSLCSPGIAKLPSGRIICTMDVFAGFAPQNLSFVFASDDGGKTWRYLTDLFPCFWGKPFVHRGALYMLSHASEYGDLQIGRSDDGGQTWAAPVRLLPGSGLYSAKGPHKAPMPVTAHGGRLWTAVDYGCWHLGGHDNALISIDENADLLVPENWSMTGFHKYDPAVPGAIPEGKTGCIEGSAVVSPDGALYNFLRYNSGDYPPAFGRALLAKADAADPDAPLVFDRIIDFPGAHSKFTVLRDEASGGYFSITSLTTDPENPRARNVIALQTSRDLFNWRVADILIDRREDDPKQTGFQYVDFIFDEDDIVYACRTAINRAKNFHDANCINVARIKDFRRFL